MKDRTLLELLPSCGRGKYLAPDFQDLVEEYLATRPGSDERHKLIANKSGMITDIYHVCIFIGSLPLLFIEVYYYYTQYRAELHNWRHNKAYEKHVEASAASKERRERYVLFFFS